MAKHPFIVIGAGAAGCTAAALLAKMGHKVLLVEQAPYLGGRAATFHVDGFKLWLGARLLEDSGTGLTRILRHLGKKLEHGKPAEAFPFYHQGKWQNIPELYKGEKDQLKRIIQHLVEMDYDSFDELDDMLLRDWVRQHTSSAGILTLFESMAVMECLTDHWWNHSASDNLWTRKNHYQERRMAGYSFVPVGGNEVVFDLLAEALRENGGEVRTGTRLLSVLIEEGRVKGVTVAPARTDGPNEYPLEIIESPCVIFTLPAWQLFDVVNPKDLPDWYANQIALFARDEHRMAWIGIYVASEEPIYAIHLRELTSWIGGPLTSRNGFSMMASQLDPTAAPEGKHLFVCGMGVPYPCIRNPAWVRNMFHLLEQELSLLFPRYREPSLWKKYHVVDNFGVAQKPMMVGRFRPSNEAPGVEGLYFCGDTFRSRGVGVDRAARSALTTVEKATGTVIEELKEVWHYR